MSIGMCKSGIIVLAIFLVSCGDTPVGTAPPFITPPIVSPDVPLATPIPTLPAVFEAVTKEDLSCFFGTDGVYSVTLTQFQVVMVVGKNTIGDWILLRLEQFADCWAELRLLNLHGDINSLPVISDPLMTSTSTLTPVVSPTATPTDAVPANFDPVELRWKVITYECNGRGDVISVTIDLDISGGIPPYTSDPPLPVNTVPRQILSIKVSSDTIDGEPSKTINFPVPRSSDFKCRNSGNIPSPQLTDPTSTPTPRKR